MRSLNVDLNVDVVMSTCEISDMMISLTVTVTVTGSGCNRANFRQSQASRVRGKEGRLGV